jgi:hypothetical protein
MKLMLNIEVKSSCRITEILQLHESGLVCTFASGYLPTGFSGVDIAVSLLLLEFN